MTDRTDVQAAINALTAKQGITDSITPTNLASDQFQVLLDNSLMIDEESGTAGFTTKSLTAPTFDDARFFSGLGLADTQTPPWVIFEGGSATVTIVNEVVFGVPQDVHFLDDNTTGGIANVTLLLDAADWVNIFTFGASYGGPIRLDTDAGQQGAFWGLGVLAADSPDAPITKRRFGLNIRKSSTTNELRISGTDGSALDVDVTGTNFDEYNDVTLKILPATPPTAEVYVNSSLIGTLTLNDHVGGNGTDCTWSSGSTSGIQRQTYMPNYGVTIYTSTNEILIGDEELNVDTAETVLPPGNRDYTITIKESVTGSEIGNGFKLTALNNGGSVTINNENPSNPKALFNGLSAVTIPVSDGLNILGTNTVEGGNTYSFAEPDQVTKSSWVNPFDDHIISASGNRIDGFPDIGAGGADATYTLLPATSYALGWSCDIYNDTAQDWHVFINEFDGNQLRDIKKGHAINIRVNDTKTGFIMVAIKGDEPIFLDPAIYGDFNNFTVWQNLTSTRLIMANATAAQISNFAPFMEFNAGGGIFYTIDMSMRNDINGFLIQCIVTSTQDSTNVGLSRTYRRFGPDMPTSTANDWSTEAKLEDTVSPQFINAQEFIDQGPTTTDTIHTITFGGVQNASGAVEVLADGTIKWNKTGNYTIDITAQFGRTSSPGTAELVLYGAVNVVSDGNGAPDTDYFASGRQFSAVLDDQNIVLPVQFTNHNLNITALPFSIRYTMQRSSVGNNDGNLIAVPFPVTMDHAGTAFPSAASASAGLSIWRNGLET